MKIDIRGIISHTTLVGMLYYYISTYLGKKILLKEILIPSKLIISETQQNQLFNGITMDDTFVMINLISTFIVGKVYCIHSTPHPLRCYFSIRVMILHYN